MSKVEITAGVPDEAPLVVRTNAGTVVLHRLVRYYVGLLAAIPVVIALVAAAAGEPLLLLAGLVPVPAIWFAARSMREYQAMLRPQLAAGETGVWVRTGVGGRAEAAFLPWSAIDGVEVAGGTVRITSREGEALYPERAPWRVRRVRRRHGTAFVVKATRTSWPAEPLAERLRELVPA